MELGRTDHKRILTRLVCVCAEEKSFREKYNLEDTSQKGDGEGWRNETLITSTSVMGPRPINNVDADDPAAVFKEYEPFVPVPWDIEEEDCTVEVVEVTEIVCEVEVTCDEVPEEEEVRRAAGPSPITRSSS